MRFPLNILLLALHATSAVVASVSTQTAQLNMNMTELELLDRSFNNAILGLSNLSQEIGLLVEEFDKTMTALNTMVMIVTLEVLLDQQMSNMTSVTAAGDNGSKGPGLKGNEGNKSKSKRSSKGKGGQQY